MDRYTGTMVPTNQPANRDAKLGTTDFLRPKFHHALIKSAARLHPILVGDDKLNRARQETNPDLISPDKG